MVAMSTNTQFDYWPSRCWASIMAFVLIVLVFVPTVRSDDRDKVVSTEIVRTIWQRRQVAVRSAHFESSAWMYYKKGSVIRRLGLPKTDLKYLDPSVGISVDGNRIRYENTQPRLESGHDHRYTSAFDGTTSFQMESPGPLHEQGVGILGDAEKYSDTGNLHLWPVLLWCRPFHPDVLGEAQFEMTSATATIGGRPCVQAVTPMRGESRSEFWLDKERDFVVVKFAVVSQGNPTAQLRIEYETGKEIAWQPSAWIVTFLGSKTGEEYTKSDATVQKSSVNVPLADDLFRIEFPPDTVVTDFRTREKWLVLPNGNKRIITPAELNQPFTLAKLRSTRAGELDPAAQKPGMRPFWVTIYAVAIGFGLALYVFLRHRKKRLLD